MRRSGHNLALVVGVLLIAAAVRVPGLVKTTPLHPDEALYASLSRQMVIEGDPYLWYQTTDKSPVTFLLIGSSLLSIGEHDMAARLLGFWLSMIGLAALYALLNYRFDRRTAFMGLLLATLSPLEARYAAAAFQDVPMLATSVVAMWLLSRQKFTAGGLLFGLSVMMKPTALWLLPLIIYTGWPGMLRQAWRFIAGLSLPVVSVIIWDWNRPQSLFASGASNNNPGRVIRSDELWPRFETWLSLLQDLIPGGMIGLVLLGLSIVAIFLLRGRQYTQAVVWLNFAIGYLALHWLIAFNTYDRYLLMIGPVVWIVGGVILSRQQRLIPLIVVLVVLTGFWPARRSASTDFVPDLHGIEKLGAVLAADYEGRIIYDHWLGWELGWYGGGDLWLVYFATPEALADHLENETGERFFVAPDADAAAFWIETLEHRGLHIELVETVEDFVIYRVMP